MPTADSAPIASRTERLCRLLDGLRTAPVAVVWAPVGYGKQRLVADWLASDTHVAAISVAEGERIDSIRRRARAAADAGSLAVVVVSAEANITDKVTLAQLVDLASASDIRLLVATSMRPDLPIGSLAAQQRLLLLDADQLAYTAPEVIEQAKRSSEDPMARPTSIAPATAQQLIADTAGWPALVDFWLQRARLSRPEDPASAHLARPDGGPADDATNFASAQALTAAFIDEQVLAPLSDADRGLLTDLSVLPVLDPPSIIALLGDEGAPASLSRLQARGVPLTWDASNRIHFNPALRQFLVAQAAIHAPDRKKALARSGAGWILARGAHVDAVELALALSETRLAAVLTIELIARNMHLTSLTEQLRQLEQLGPRLSHVLGADLILSLAANDGATTPAAVQPALEELVRTIPAEDSELRPGLAMLSLNAWRRSGYPEHSDVRASLETAAAFDDSWLNEFNRAQCAGLLVEFGEYHMQLDRYDAATTPLTRACGLAQITHAHWISVLALGNLALVRAVSGRHTGAAELAAEALTLFEHQVWDGYALDTPAVVAQVVLTMDSMSPLRIINMLRPYLDNPGRLRDMEAVVTALSSLALISVGEADAAIQAISAYRMSAPARLFPIQRILLHAAAAAAYLALGQFDDARAEYSNIGALPLETNALWQTVFTAHGLIAQARAEEAFILLRDLARVDEEHASRAQVAVLSTFATVAAQIGEIEVATAAAQRGRRLAERLGVAWANSVYAYTQAPPGQKVHLTDAERNVLSHLQANETIEEAAARLFVSPNTLKTHLRRIYRKLGVHDRESALQRARTLGIHQRG